MPHSREVGGLLTANNNDSNVEARTRFKESVLFYKDASQMREELDFVAELPQIVGYVPLAEREFFSTYISPGTAVAFDRAVTAESVEYNELMAGLPGVQQVIQQDIDLLDIPGLEQNTILMNRRVTRAGAIELFLSSWHVDTPNPFYLVRNNNSPEHYAGPAKLTSPGVGEQLGFYPDVVIGDQSVVPFQAPDFAIVRMGPFSVHRKKRFSKTVVSTLMTAETISR